MDPIQIGDNIPDDGIINRSDPVAMLEWARLLGAHQAQILTAVAVVGPAYRAVQNYLRNWQYRPPAAPR